MNNLIVSLAAIVLAEGVSTESSFVQGRRRAERKEKKTFHNKKKEVRSKKQAENRLRASNAHKT